MSERDATLVLDIGKTNCKLTLIDADGGTLAEQRCPNAIVFCGQYAHHDTERIWEWMLATLRAFARIAKVGAIVPVTHGATAALVNSKGLVLPVLDYESKLPEQINKPYETVRPPFEQTYSPALPAGLNLGRQLEWQASRFRKEFEQADHILMYPQYWAWRLSGIAASEVTSLGCHTDLWDTKKQQYSTLVAQRGWTELFPPVQPASAILGPLLPALAELTGLPADCKILCGIHDSNASLLRYLGTDIGAVLSTGTWVIAASFGTSLDDLCERADMLANTNAMGEPVACMRFMGGREFSVLAGPTPAGCTIADIQYIIDQGIVALPSFAESGGPFNERAGSIAGAGPRTDQEWYALATLYCALMSDYCLTSLDAVRTIALEGSFGANSHYAALLASLRPGQPIVVSDDANGTTCGARLLHRGAQLSATAHAKAQQPSPVEGLTAYRKRWQNMLGSAQYDRREREPIAV